MRLPVRRGKPVTYNSKTKRTTALVWAWCVLLLSFACSKKTSIPPITETVTEYIVKDCTIVIPADTHQLFLLWSELCDTTVRYSPVPVVRTVKKNRVTVTVQTDTNGITFICREDSLLKVIDLLRTTNKQTTQGGVTDGNGRGLPQYSILVLAVALVVIGMAMLLRR